MQTTQYQFFATTAKGLELLLVDELRELGAVDAAEKLAGVTFTGNLELAYKACLWSRLANRILLQLHQFSAESAEELYAGIQAVNWDEHLDVDGTFAVHSVCSQSTLTHSLFIAQKVKDAIVDQFRDQYDRRPDVSKETPQVNVYVYLYRNTAHVYLDLSGESFWLDEGTTSITVIKYDAWEIFKNVKEHGQTLSEYYPQYFGSLWNRRR